MGWLWHEWNDEAKPWANLGTPCTPQYNDLLAATTKVIIGKGKKPLFGEASWLDGRIKAEKIHRQQCIGG
jgi:hypothetical protein